MSIDASVITNGKENPGRRSLVLAGGGVRLAYHAGVLMALDQKGIRFNHIDGTSGGIFGTAMLASGISPVEAAARWRKLRLRDFMAALPLRNYRSRYHLQALGSAAGIRNKIFPALGIDIRKINKNSAFEATFNVCNFTTKAVEAISQERVTADHLIAGVSLPVFMPAVKINNDWYTDAVWVKDANLTEAVRRDADEIWLVWCIGNTPEYRNGFLNQYVHMIEISASAGLFTEIEWISEWNKKREAQGLNAVALYIIKPEYPLPLDPDFFLRKINADTLINMGYSDTIGYLETKTAFNLDEPYASTSMKSPGNTVHFRQQFTGRLSIASNIYSLCIRLSFFIREIDGKYIFQLFASVDMKAGRVIPGYHCSLSVQEKGLVTADFSFDYDGGTYLLRSEIRFTGVAALMMGLDAGYSEVTIAEAGREGNSSTFIQPAISRLKNAAYLNLNPATGLINRIKTKRRLLHAFIKYQHGEKIHESQDGQLV